MADRGDVSRAGAGRGPAVPSSAAVAEAAAAEAEDVAVTAGDVAGRDLYVPPASAASVVTGGTDDSIRRLKATERLTAANVHRGLTEGAGLVAGDSAGVSHQGSGGGGGAGGAGFLVVGEMSRSGRGMHTTTTVTLIRLQGGGLLADTPGERGVTG